MEKNLVLYDFTNLTCLLEGNVLTSKDENVQVIFQDNASKISREIIPLYEKYGCECLEFLNGAISFCLYDKFKQQLLVCRDKIGIKSMYYAQLPTGFVCSNTLKDVIKYVNKPQLRIHELAQPIRHNYPIDLQHTWIEQIKRLRAGEYAIVDKDGFRLRQYWKRRYLSSFSGTENQAIIETRRLIRESVKRCMQTDEPVAVLLSGGIDSTSLALFAKECQKEVHVISAGYKGKFACDERQVARRFAEENELIYHEVELDAKDFKNLFEEYLPYIDEPCFDVSSMSQYALYKKAAEMGFKVILSGLGGDELFYSYKCDNDQILSLRLKRELDLCFPLKKNWKSYLKFLLNNTRYVLMSNYPILLNDKQPVAWTYDDYKRFSKSASLLIDNQLYKFNEIRVEPHFDYNDDVNEVYEHKFTTFANQLCVYLGNKLGEAAGVELRFPLLDAELIDFLDTLPVDMKFRPNVSKYFQKEVMKGLLPDYILSARKRGFEPPFDYIREMCNEYKYHVLEADYVFFNSMMADKLLVQYLNK